MLSELLMIIALISTLGCVILWFVIQTGCLDSIRQRVIPPILRGFKSRSQATMANFCFGVIPPMAILGRS